MRIGFVWLTVAACLTGVTPAAAEDECMQVVNNMVPSEFRMTTLQSTLQELKKRVCDETQSSGKGGLALTLPIPGLGPVELGASGQGENRRKLCKDFEKYVNTTNAATILIRDDRAKIDAIRACPSKPGVQAVEVELETATGRQVAFSIRRAVQGGSSLLRALTVLGGKCFLPADLAGGTKSLNYEDRVHLLCEREADATWLYLHVDTDTGHYVGVAPSSTAFTLRYQESQTNRKSFGLTPRKCKKTCNGHNKPGACPDSISYTTDEPNVTLGLPVVSTCDPKKWPRCRAFAHPAPAIFLNGDRTVHQDWGIGSRSVTICLQATRYADQTQSIVKEAKITIGPTWSTLPVGPESHPLLIDDSGQVHDPNGMGMIDGRHNQGKLEVRLRPLR